MRDVKISHGYDVERIRASFPALHQHMPGGYPLVYLDNAASTQKPQAVINRLTAYYSREHSNVHRGAHHLSQRATDAYEGARKRIARYLNAAHDHEIIFTRGTTEAINLVASSFGRSQLCRQDNIVISTMEHHSNVVPWQLICQEKEAHLRVIPVNQRGELVCDTLSEYLGPDTRLLALVHVSNSLGTINPVRKVIAAAHERGIPVLLDGAQAMPHMRVDVQALDCDFYCFSGHKVFGPTGIGVLYGKETLLDMLPPYQGGGDMIQAVTFEKSTYASLPHKFEAGTPNIADALGLATALDTLEEIGLPAISTYEQKLLAYAHRELEQIDGLRLIGTAREKASVISFLLEDVSPYDTGRFLDERGIAVRSGHHCTMPLMHELDIPGTVRASLALYNTRDEIDTLVAELRAIQQRLDRWKQRKPATTRKNNPHSIQQRRTAIIEEFDIFDDKDSKREYLMELGDELPSYKEAWKTETHRIHGCLSMVWLHTTINDGRIHFCADSNSMITKGMVALLVRLLNGHAPEDILATDIDRFLEEVGLPEMISSQRKNGLGAMIKRIKLDTSILAQSTKK